MFAVVGTVPEADFPLLCGPAALSGGKLLLENRLVAINRGTPALLASAGKACEFLGSPYPTAYLAGDTGRGEGSRKIYARLEKNLGKSRYTSITFHYLQPDVDWHNRVLFALDNAVHRPVLIADAGFMYAAKMSGQAESYDLFTPDIGELAFLADPAAPHPFYTRGFIFHEPERAQELIEAAYAHHNAAKYLLVKGRKDIVASKSGILAAIEEPVVDSLEAIGGTGDIITGLAAVFTGHGKDPAEASRQAAAISRIAGELAAPDPGTQVGEIIEQIPAALSRFFARQDAGHT